MFNDYNYLLYPVCKQFSFPLIKLTSIQYVVLDNSTLKVLPPSQTFTMGLNDDELVTLNCSVRANPLPLLQWRRYSASYNGTLSGVQAATGFNETAFSTFTVNITELGVGTHNFQCTATVDTPATQSESSSANTTITVQALLQNIRVVPETQTFTLENNPNDIIALNCLVEASPGPPRIEWLVNGEDVVSQRGQVTPARDSFFFSTLILTLGELEPGVNDITCSAFQDAETPPTNVVGTATVTIRCKSSPATS